MRLARTTTRISAKICTSKEKRRMSSPAVPMASAVLLRARKSLNPASAVADDGGYDAEDFGHEELGV